jgi:hypothetical protein
LVRGQELLDRLDIQEIRALDLVIFRASRQNIQRPGNRGMGRPLCNLLPKFFPHCTVTSIDTFAGSSEHIDDPEWSELIAGCEQRFDANLAEYGPRSEKIKARSCLGLASLATSLRSFDFIYVDGSHHSSDVYIDSAASWPLLVRGGILIFDDYEWPGRPTEVECPKLGVDAFLASHAGHYRELHRGYEIVIEKT